MAQIRLGKIKEVPAGKGKAFDVGQRCVAVFNVGGKFYALDDTCPHKGGSLASGYLGDTDIVCPLHSATFALADGAGLAGPCGDGVHAYPVTISGDDIEIEVPD